MRIAIGSDHAGFELKQHFIELLKGKGHEVVDKGAYEFDSADDYPVFCSSVGRAVGEGEVDRGIVLGGSGQGEQLAANKVSGTRAALCNDLYTAEFARRHNDANILALGARVVGISLAELILDKFLETDFEGGRHVKRLEMLAEIEAGEIPG